MKFLDFLVCILRKLLEKPLCFPKVSVDDGESNMCLSICHMKEAIAKENGFWSKISTFCFLVIIPPPTGFGGCYALTLYLGLQTISCRGYGGLAEQPREEA